MDIEKKLRNAKIKEYLFLSIIGLDGIQVLINRSEVLTGLSDVIFNVLFSTAILALLGYLSWIYWRKN